MNMLQNLTSKQWWANARHWITYVVGIVCGIADTLGYLNASQQADLLQAVSGIFDHINGLVTSIVALITILAPIINGLKAGSNAGPAAQIKSVQAMATAPVPSPEAKTALVAATDALPEIAGVLTTNTPAGTNLAASVPTQTVVP